MGSNQSSPPPPPAPPVLQEADYPGGNRKSTINPDKPVNPQTDGVSISKSKDCTKCDLEFVPGISTSSVSLTRAFGGVRACGRFDADLALVRAKEMAVRDFVGGIQSGQYLRKSTEGFCEEVRFPDEVVQKISTIDDLNANLSKLTSVRIRKISSEGFSSDTKAIIKPSIPFNMSFNGTAFTINTITVYHPCPLRVQDQQADAVISLNDPSMSDSPYIILIPITTGNPGTPSAEFFAKIANQLSNIELPNPATGQYTRTDIQTGKDWGLSNLFPIGPVANGRAKVNAGYFVWEGMPPLEQYVEIDTPSLKKLNWRRKAGSKRVTYIMLEKPLAVNPNDLASLIRSVPVTDWSEAIHEILEPTMYKQGPPGTTGSCNIPMREHMSSRLSNRSYQQPQPEVELACDPFNPMTAQEKGFSTDKILTLMFNVVLLLAAAIGAYVALAAVARMYDVEYADFTKGIGKVMAMWARSLGGRVSAAASLPTAASAFRAMAAALPTAAQEQPSVPEQRRRSTPGLGSPIAPTPGPSLAEPAPSASEPVNPITSMVSAIAPTPVTTPGQRWVYAMPPATIPRNISNPSTEPTRRTRSTARSPTLPRVDSSITSMFDGISPPARTTRRTVPPPAVPTQVTSPITSVMDRLSPPARTTRRVVPPPTLPTQLASPITSVMDNIPTTDVFGSRPPRRLPPILPSQLTNPFMSPSTAATPSSREQSAPPVNRSGTMKNNRGNVLRRRWN